MLVIYTQCMTAGSNFFRTCAVSVDTAREPQAEPVQSQAGAEAAQAPVDAEPTDESFVPACRPEDLPKGGYPLSSDNLAAHSSAFPTCSCVYNSFGASAVTCCQAIPSCKGSTCHGRHTEGGAGWRRQRAALLVPLADLRHRVPVR